MNDVGEVFYHYHFQIAVVQLEGYLLQLDYHLFRGWNRERIDIHYYRGLRNLFVDNLEQLVFRVL